MVKKLLKAIEKFFNEGPSPSGLGGFLDSDDLCDRQKCSFSEKKEIIKEDYSI